MSDELAVIQRAYDLTAWAVPAIAKFPRSRRFVLGGRMENALYDVLELGTCRIAWARPGKHFR